MQVWPLAAKIPARSPLVTASGSASAKMIWGDLPPSSSTVGVRLSAAARATCLAVAPPPVKVILSMPGWAVMAAPTSAPPVTTLMTPGGNPASAVRSASISAVTGVISEGFMIAVHPAASSGASFQVSRASGEFHGMMAPTTPTGSRSVYTRKLGDGLGSCSPPILSAMPAKKS